MSNFTPDMPDENILSAQNGPAPPAGRMEFSPMMPPGYDGATTQAMARQTSTLSPDAVASDILLAERVGYPADMVARNRDYFRDMDLARRVDETLSGAPAVRGVYNKNPLTAGLLMDDLDNAVDLEKLLSEYQPPLAKSHADTRAPRLRYSNESPTAAEAQRIHGYQLSKFERLPVAAMEGMLAMAENGLSFLSGLSEIHTSTMQDIYRDLPIQDTAIAASPFAKGLETFLKDYRRRSRGTALRPTGDWTQDFIEDVARMGPQVTAQWSIYAAGGFIPSMFFMGTQIAGGKHAYLTDDEAQDKERAFIASLADAGLQAPLEALAVGKVLNIFKGTGIAQVVKAGGEAILTEFATEWAQKYPDALTTLWAEAEHKGRDVSDTLRYFADHFWQYTREGMYEGLVASVYGLVGGGGKIGYEYSRYLAGRMDGDFFAALDESAKGSKTRERLPQEYQKVVEALAAGGPVESVYVSPRAMREAAGDESAFFQLAERVGLTREDISRAEELGADLEIPLPLYQTHVAGTDASLKMRDDVKFRPEDMSLAERMSFERDMSSLFPGELAAALQRVEANMRTSADLDAALAPVEEQLRTVYGKEATRANMDVLKARARIAADWWTEAGENLTPAQVVTDKWGLRVEIGEQEAALSGADLLQAMNRSNASTLREFAAQVAEKPGAQKDYFDVSPSEGFFSGVEIWYPEDSIRHKEKRHADMTHEDMDRFSSVLAALTSDSVGVPKKSKPRNAGKVLFGHAVIDGQAYGVIIESVSQGKALVDSYFKDSIDGVKNWFEEKTDAKKAVKTPAALWLAQVAPSDANAFPDQPSDANIHTNPHGVKARGSITFTDTGAVIRLFRDAADMSTFAHEAAHLFMKDMQALVDSGNAPFRVAQDFQRLQAFAYAGGETVKTYYEKEYVRSREGFAGRPFESLSMEEYMQLRHVAEQEKLADAFLTYLGEGRAPSPELRSPFRRFADWLKGLYQSLMGTVRINDDVRGVFDRMLAADADIALAESLHAQDAANMEAINGVAREMLAEAEQRRLEELRREAGETSREARMTKTLRGYFDSLLGKKELTEKARKDVAARPVYAAMDLALAGGGISRESVISEFGEETAKELNRRQPALVRKTGGLDVHDLALACDFTSAGDMIQSILQAPLRPKAVAEQVKAELAAREAVLRKDMDALDAIPGEADYYNDSRLPALLLELRALERKAGNRVYSRAGTAGISRQWARDILGAMPVREALNVGKHAAAEARAAAESAKAAAGGRTEDAAAAKRRQAVNHAMVLEALELRKRQDSVRKALRRWERSKTMDFGCQEQILALAGRYGVGGDIRKGVPRFSPRKPDELPPLARFIEELIKDDTFGAPPFSDFLLSESVPDLMSMGQMEEVWDAMRWLAEQGSPGEATLIAEGVAGSVKSAAEEGAAALRASGNTAKVYEEGTLLRSASDKWRHIFATLNELKDQMRKADGYVDIGPEASHIRGFHSQLFQRLKDAQDELVRIYRNEVMPEQRRIDLVRYGFIQRFNKTLGKPLGKRAAAINGVEPPQNMKDIGRTAWTAEHIWCLARNMGNAGNLKTLHEGFGLSQEQLHSLTSILTTEEWLAVQAEGNLAGSFYERTDSVFRKVYGRPMPDKVQPRELTVTTADGKSLTLPGWYFPIAVDGKLDPDVKDRQQADIMQSDPRFTAFGPSLARNHTKGRSGTSKPVALSFDVFERALQDQLRFMTHAPVLKDFDRITRNPEWRKAYVDAFGQQAYDALRPTLKYLARPYGEDGNALEGWVARSRQLATLYILGHNTKTFVRQFQGYFPARMEVGGAWIARGMGHVARQPFAAVRAINELSPYMADRQRGYDRELRHSLRSYKAKVQIKVGDRLYSEKDVNLFTMALITTGDCMTVYPIWQGAYMKAQDHLGMGRKDAVAYADSIIQKTNASASPLDLTPLQQQGGIWRIFTMFMGESLRKGSRMRYYWGALRAGKISYARYAQHLVMESIAPALFFVGVVGLFSDDEPDRGDLAAAVFSELIGPYPFLAAVPGALQYDKPLMYSPVFTGVDSAMKAVEGVKGVYEDPNDPEAWARFYKPLIDVIAFRAGVGNVRRLYETAAEGWEDLRLGDTHNPFRLFFRKPRE